jgi:hypothetical protein
MIGSVSHTPPAHETGLRAVRAGIARVDRAAMNVARATLPGIADAGTAPTDLVGSLVEMMFARRDVEAGAAVVRRAGETQESLLDIFA